MTTLQEFQISDEYISCIEKQDFSNIPDEFKDLLKYDIERLTESKKARKKEIKRLRVLKKNLTKTVSKTAINCDDMDDEQYASYRLKQFEQYKINPYPHHFKTDFNLSNFKETFNFLKNDEKDEAILLRINGRVMLKRKSSKKLYFYTLSGNDTTIQIMISQNYYYDEEEFYQMTNIISRGDFIGVIGIPYRSKTGELSIIPRKMVLLSPCLKQLPKDIFDKNGKQLSVYHNKEQRFRNRHLDWILNSHHRNVLKTRSKIIRFIRNYFDERDFYEVETPTLNLIPSGANATPFKTYLNAFEMDTFLRIAPELKLKQMIIGGFDRVYEIGKQFRNEGVDRTHLPEFTSLEYYQQGADYYTLMDTTEELLNSLVLKINQNPLVKYNLEPDMDGIEKEIEIDFSTPFKRLDMKTSLLEAINQKIPEFSFPENLFTDEAREYLVSTLDTLGVECSEPKTTARMLDKLVGEFIEPQCINPTFIINHFQVMSPLAKYHRDDSQITERFELFIGGKEVCNAFTELNNPLVQQQLFEAQVSDKKLGDTEAQIKDTEFINALKYGLPPTGGFGMGIDRLVMFLTNNNSIREVVTYPTMKPQ